MTAFSSSALFIILTAGHSQTLQQSLCGSSYQELIMVEILHTGEFRVNPPGAFFVPELSVLLVNRLVRCRIPILVFPLLTSRFPQH
jgi:hypothetical protein